MALFQQKSTLLMASLLVAMGLSVTACSKQQAEKPTEEIAAQMGEFAKADNPAPQAKEPATPVEKLGATAAITEETTTGDTASSDATKTDEKAPATESDKTATATASTAPASDAGEKLYASTCKACHDAGVAGAPKISDKSAWKDRIAQGKDTLYKHSIEGFQGKTGVMPPKGGSTASDEEMKAAVDYMVSKVS